jgi:hypothetical protein
MEQMLKLVEAAEKSGTLRMPKPAPYGFLMNWGESPSPAAASPSESGGSAGSPPSTDAPPSVRGDGWLRSADLLKEAWGPSLSLGDGDPEHGADEPVKPTPDAEPASSSSTNSKPKK